MSSRTIRQSMLRTIKDGFRAVTSSSARRTSPSLMNRSGATPEGPHQTRSFHPTPAGRLFESSDPGPESVPPISWLQDADKKTRQDVEKTVAASFESASKAPIQHRDHAYREASFRVPHEIARLNPDAPRFRVEEVGSLSFVAKLCEELGEKDPQNKPPFNIERDARIFLYFPNDEAQATAAFVAINAQFAPQGLAPQEIGVIESTGNPARLWRTAANMWLCQNIEWANLNPDFLHRIGPTQLPVIATFRGAARGAMWDSGTASFWGPISSQLVVTLIPKPAL